MIGGSVYPALQHFIPILKNKIRSFAVFYNGRNASRPHVDEIQEWRNINHIVSLHKDRLLDLKKEITNESNIRSDRTRHNARENKVMIIGKYRPSFYIAKRHRRRSE